jgi:tRNA(fMet)-specific endonuclease VapC
MTGIVADTDVVSFLFKNDSRAVDYLPHLQGIVPVISFQTVAELYLLDSSSKLGLRPDR